MTFEELVPNLDDALARLPVHDASTARAERTRERCLAALQAQHRGAVRRRQIVEAWMDWLEPVAALGVSALYLAAAAQVSVAFLRAMR